MMAGQMFYKRKSDGAVVPINPGPQGPQGEPGLGMDLPTADARYVNVDGDTMTGPLGVQASSPQVRAEPTTTGWGSVGVFPLAGGEAKIMARDGDDNAYLSTSKDQWYATQPMRVQIPSAAQQVPRLARDPDPTTGDLGLPGYAGSSTGWRDVSADLLNGWTGTLAMVRHGHTVTYRGTLTGGTSINVYQLPPGFRTGLTTGNEVPFATVPSGAPATQENGLLGGTAVNTIRLPTGVASNFHFSVYSMDPWPSSLPGTEITPPAQWT